MQKFQSFKEKFNFFKTQNTLLCLKEKFKKKNLQKENIFFLLILPREFCAYVSFGFNFHAYRTYLVISGLFLKKKHKT